MLQKYRHRLATIDSLPTIYGSSASPFLSFAAWIAKQKQKKTRMMRRNQKKKGAKTTLAVFRCVHHRSPRFRLSPPPPLPASLLLNQSAFNHFLSV